MNHFQSGADVVRAFFERWNEQDADGVGALFAEKGQFVNVVGLWWRSRKAIRKAHQYGFRRIFAHATVEITELTTYILREDVHIVHTVSTLVGQIGPAGEIGEERVAVISFVTAIRDGSFEIVSAHNTERFDNADTHIVQDGTIRPANYRRLSFNAD